MYHLQLRVSIGTIAVTWSTQGLLQRLDWYETRGIIPQKPIQYEAPAGIQDILKRLMSFIDEGKPMGSIPWTTIDLSELSRFQIEVYEALGDIPHGETRTYAWIAHRIARRRLAPKLISPRAVGQALKRNPFPILIPCHRIVSTKDLGGFMGRNDPNLPELKLKQWLINLESRYLNPVFPFLLCDSDPASFSLHAL